MSTISRPLSLSIAGIGLLGSLALPAAAAATHGAHPATKNRCPNNRTYVQALTASYSNGVITISGHHGFFFCDKNEEFIKVRKATKTFTVEKGAPISVLKDPQDPNSAHSISAKRFPHYLTSHKKDGENYYIYKGKRTAITKLKPGFQS
jgi:hypothetical protein